MKDSHLSTKKSALSLSDKIRQLVLEALQEEDFPGLELVATAKG